MLFKKSKNLKSEFYSLEYPKKWSFEDDDDCKSFYNPNGVGALQISAYISENQITDQEQIDLIDQNVEYKKSELNGYTVIFYELLEEETFWLKYFLFSKHTVVLITYNCENRDKDLNEIESCKEIINTIKINS